MVIKSPDGRRFRVLLLGSADYVLLPIAENWHYNANAKRRLFSVNSSFVPWVEAGCQGELPANAVRWEVQKLEDGSWRTTTQTDEQAIKALGL